MKKRNLLFLLLMSFNICNIIHAEEASNMVAPLKTLQSKVVGVTVGPSPVSANPPTLKPITPKEPQKPEIQNVSTGSFETATDTSKLKEQYEAAIMELIEKNKDLVSGETIQKVQKAKDANLAKLADVEAGETVPPTATLSGSNENTTTQSEQNNKKNDEDKEKPYSEEEIAEKKKAYEDAKANEQSTANKLLTATSIAAMGGGAMELAQGMAEKKADEAAEQDMSAYIETFRCTYANGKQVKGGPEPVELPGGNDSKLMSLRNEYITLAKDLKERKTALGMAPGIEAEEILDKAEMGLYDDENLGKTGGAYASLYRAKALNSEEDQKKLDAEKEATSKRIKGGAIALGAGAAVGIVGNSLINGKLGEKIKDLKEKKAKGEKVDTADDKETIAVLKRGLKVSGLKLTEVNKVPWKKLDGIGAVKEYAQGINFGLIPHDEAMKITSMTTTEVVGDQVEEWYTNQHKDDTPEDVAAQQQSAQILCEQSKDNGAITGTWDDTNNSCICKTNTTGKEVTFTSNDGCIYVQPEETDCTDEDKAKLNDENAELYKKDGSSCKIEKCKDGYTTNSDGTKCQCAEHSIKLKDGTCLASITNTNATQKVPIFAEEATQKGTEYKNLGFTLTKDSCMEETECEYASNGTSNITFVFENTSASTDFLNIFVDKTIETNTQKKIGDSCSTTTVAHGTLILNSKYGQTSCIKDGKETKCGCKAAAQSDCNAKYKFDSKTGLCKKA